MKFVSLLMVATLSLTGVPTYAYAVTPVDGGDAPTVIDFGCPTWLQWLCGKGK